MYFFGLGPVLPQGTTSAVNFYLISLVVLTLVRLPNQNSLKCCIYNCKPRSPQNNEI